MAEPWPDENHVPYSLSLRPEWQASLADVWAGPPSIAWLRSFPHWTNLFAYFLTFAGGFIMA